MKTYKKRGYVKWTDEDGVFHKVRENEYEGVEEIVEEDMEDADRDLQEPASDRLV